MNLRKGRMRTGGIRIASHMDWIPNKLQRERTCILQIIRNKAHGNHQKISIMGTRSMTCLIGGSGAMISYRND